MKTVWLALLTLPSLIIYIGIALGIALRPSFGLGLPPVFGLLLLLSFVISVALIFVFPNSKEWRIAAFVNGIPLALLLLFGILLAIGGG
jgi:hypothetical protein